jgi:hypothetical protein
MDAGVDSLGAVELRNQLSLLADGKQLPSTLVFDYPTTRQIALLVMPDPSEAPVEAPTVPSSLPAAAPPSLPGAAPPSVPADGHATTSGHAAVSASVSGQSSAEKREYPKDVFEDAAGLVSSISSLWTQFVPWSASSTQEANTVPTVGSTPTSSSKLYGPADGATPAVAYDLDGLQKAIMNFEYQFKHERVPSKPPSYVKVYDGEAEDVSTHVDVGHHVFNAARGVSAASIRQMLEAHRYKVYATHNSNAGDGKIQRVFFMGRDDKSPYLLE